jgi:osmotically-inducible protein OsmY
MTITFVTASSMRSARMTGVPGLSLVVRDGIGHLSGIITDERSRQAAVVRAENIAGVKKVYDHLCWVDPLSGMYFIAPEDEQLAKSR